MEEVKKKRRSNSVDRIVLAPESQTVLKQISELVAESTQGMLQIPLRELANFVIQRQSPVLTESELAELRAKYSDDVKIYKWAWEQARRAKIQGQTVDHSLLQKIIQMQSVDGKPCSKKLLGGAKRTKRPAPPSDNLAPEEPALNVGQASKID